MGIFQRQNLPTVGAFETRVSFLLKKGLSLNMRSTKKTQRTKRSKKNSQENIMAEENKTTTQGDAQAKFESSKTHVRQAAGDLKSAAEAVAGDLKSAAGAMAEQYRGRGGTSVGGDARSRAHLPGR